MRRDDRMHKWIFICSVAALIAAACGYSATPKMIAMTGKLAFFLFLSITVVIFLVSKIDYSKIHHINHEHDINDLKIKDEWKKKRKQLQQTLVTLTEDDLIYAGDNEEELIKHIQQRLGASKQEAHNIIRNI